MPITKADAYSTQISENIFKLTNIAPIPLDLKSIFSVFDQPSLIRFFEQHQKLGLDLAPFIFGFLVHVAVMLDGAELFNPDSTGFTTSLNMFVQLVGEPGQYSNSFYFYHYCLPSIFLFFQVQTNLAF